MENLKELLEIDQLDVDANEGVYLVFCNLMCMFPIEITVFINCVHHDVCIKSRAFSWCTPRDRLVWNI